MTRKVLMLGPALDVMGGITSVTQTWLAWEGMLFATAPDDR